MNQFWPPRIRALSERKSVNRRALLAVTRNSGETVTKPPGPRPQESWLVASRPPDESLDQRHHPLAAESFGQTLRVPFNDDHMTVMEES